MIIGAAEIHNYEKLAAYLQPESDFYIFCDGGLHHRQDLAACLQKLHAQCSRPLAPDLIVGDFDSHPAPQDFDCPIIRLPQEKDDTDTWYAVKEALGHGFQELLLIGVVGQRLDHSLGNLSILLHLHDLNKPALLVDDFSEMEIVGQRAKCIADSFSYFSLLNIDGTAKGLTIRNARYPLDKAEISCTYQYAISNQVLPGRVAEVEVEEGRLLLVRVF